jgi:hypothetical protein
MASRVAAYGDLAMSAGEQSRAAERLLRWFRCQPRVLPEGG